MPSHFSAKGWRHVLAAVAVCAAAVPARAQVFDFDNVVMYANRDLFAGYNDVWGFVGNDGREYIIQGLTTGTAWWDVEDPINPVLVATIPAPASTWRDMFVIGDYAYIGCENGSCGIQIVDISDPTAPVLATTYTATLWLCPTVFGDPSRNLLYVVGGYTNTTNGGIQIFDVTNPLAPVEIGQWDNRYVHDMSIEGDRIYACLINNGRLRIIDVSDSTAPANLGTAYVDPTGAVHASWPLGDGIHIAIAEETGGGHVKIIDATDVNSIVLDSSNNPAPGASAHNVHVEGTNCFVSWYARGTRVLDVSNPSAVTEVGYWDTYPDTDAGGVGPGNWGTYPHLPSGLIASNDGKYGLFLLEYDPTAGTVDGTVSSSAGGLLSGATAEFVDLNLDQTTDATGVYKFSSFAGAGRKVRFSAFGHDPDSVTVVVPSDGTVTNHVVLTKKPAGAIDGVITELGSGNPIPGVEVTLVGTPLTAVTDSAGAYSFPDVPSASYTLDVMRYGYKPSTGNPVTVSTSQTTSENLQLTPGAFFTDFSDPSAWTIVNTDLSDTSSTATGFWEFGEPFGTYQSGIPFQAELDHTLDPDDQAAVTGNSNTGSIGGDDVDLAITRLLSPVYDLSSMSQPHLFYYLWYAVNTQGEFFEVDYSTNGGSTWTQAASTNVHAPTWTGYDIDLTGLLGAANAVQFRFTAQDPANSQVVEAALDDVTIYDAGATVVDSPVLPPNRLRLELAQNAPNPFRGGTDIRFTVPNKEYVQVSVYDVRGSRVATLVDGVMDAGNHSAAWDGRNFAGKRAAAGIYFYKLQTKSEIRSRKMVRLQ